MADPGQILEGLRKIHPPAGADSASPALLMTLTGSALSIALCAAFWSKFRRWREVRRATLEALAAARHLPPGERLAAQAAVLRRLIRTLCGDGPARQQGRDWLACLDSAFSTRFFTEARGQIFGEALYRPLSGQDVDALDHSLRRLFARIPR